MPFRSPRFLAVPRAIRMLLVFELRHTHRKQTRQEDRIASERFCTLPLWQTPIFTVCVVSLLPGKGRVP